MSLKLSYEKATQELLRRRMAQESLVAFTRYTFPAYKPAAHHELVAEKLEAVARGEIRRLLIEMPPFATARASWPAGVSRPGSWAPIRRGT
jgi:hypothetical protein